MFEYPYSKIKSIYLPLFNYKFDHGPSDVENSNHNFKGREKIKDRIQLLFQKPEENPSSGRELQSQHGAYLITGYRGMGKTSVVREAFSDKKTGSKHSFKEKNNLKIFNFSLSQDEVRDIDLLRQIGVEVIDFCNNEILKEREEIDNIRIYGINFINAILSLAFLFLGLVILIFVTKDFVGETKPYFLIVESLTEILSSIGTAFLFFVLWILIMGLFGPILRRISSLPFYKHRKEYERLKQNLSLFEKRLFSSVILEDKGGIKTHLGDTNPLTAISNKLLQNLEQRDNIKYKDTLNYSMASPKEIEQYLRKVLRDIEVIRNLKYFFNWKRKVIPDFIFIVDELDKVEPDYFFAPGDRESDQYLHHNETPFHITTKARKRQEAIAKLLANLKNFLNDAKAKFIFIGGRDIYDASLADVADRESFYSSIFNEVIYVNTFFKDKEMGSENAGLSQLTENYLFQFLLPLDKENQPTAILPNSSNKMEDYIKLIDFEKDNKDGLIYEKQFKIIHTLQNFFIFLLYRSNGSPKKLIELIEKFIVRKPNENWNDWVIKLKNGDCENAKLYLRFSYKDQYEINLTSNLYRPYTIINSRFLKSLGDKLLYSSAFLLDHILKFHRTAFSWRNLEMIPDIILANKDPNFRPFFRDLMQFLSNQHIRQTLNAVFQYKFYNKVKNEIEYLSKTSEFSSAAFNFTLDESFHLKSYYKKKLAAKYLEYREFDNRNTGKDYIQSIGYLHSLIADLHYYDEEFDDAIIHYSDSIQSFSDFQKKGSLQDHQVVPYTSNLMNLGLSFEKIQSYDKAHAVYRNLIIFSKSFNKKKENGQAADSWDASYKRMQLFLRPYIAILGVIEKQRTDGITFDNLTRNISEYVEFLGMAELELFPSEKNNIIDYDEIEVLKEIKEKNGNMVPAYQDKKRIITLLVDYYMNVGGILFFKNHIYFRMLYRGNKIVDEKVTMEIKNYFEKNKEAPNTNRYRPSHAAYLYYLHALCAIISPYYENKYAKVEGNKVPKLASNNNLVEKLIFLFFFLDGKSYPILNSNQKETIANILSKLGDALLSCIPPIDKEKNVTDQLGIEALKLVAQDFKEISSLFLERLKTFETNDNLHSELVFLIYGLSYQFYYQAGKTYSASFQLKKILYILRDSSKAVVKKYKKEKLLDCTEKIAQKILKNLAGVSNASNRAQISKYRFYTNDKEDLTNHIYQGVSTENEVKEVLSMVETLRLKYPGGHREVKISLNPYSTVSSMFSRLFELKLYAEKIFDEIEEKIGIVDKSEIVKLFQNFEQIKKGITDIKHGNKNFENVDGNSIGKSKATKERAVTYFEDMLKGILKEYENEKPTVQKSEIKDDLYLLKQILDNDINQGWNPDTSLCESHVFLKQLKNTFEKIKEYNTTFSKVYREKDNQKEDYEFIIPRILDGLFACINAVKILNTYGAGYILTNSFLASFHRLIGLYGILYEVYNFYEPEPENSEIFRQKGDLFGEGAFIDFDPYYHFSLARQALEKAIQLHTEGKAYRVINRGMFTLDDDFNDSLTHFCAAVERYTMNSNQKYRTLERMIQNLSKSRVYNYKNYVSHEFK